MGNVAIKKYTTQRWQDCKKIQELLVKYKICEVTTTDINTYIYGAISDDPQLLAGVLEGHHKSLEVLVDLPVYKQMIEARRAKASRPKLYKPKKTTYTENVIDGPADQIKVAIWLIKKVGGVEQARKAVEAAAAALEVLK